ncbi:hypothetical protein GOP47_0028097 [Adiantum capillus-veneris]|nr:hypothetical protein GOP47_0028097 [Adiantum capillus-veneris]
MEREAEGLAREEGRHEVSRRRRARAGRKEGGECGEPEKRSTRSQEESNREQSQRARAQEISLSSYVIEREEKSSKMMEPIKEKGVQVVDMFMDLEAPSISLEIGSHSMTIVQLDGGVAVSLMTEQTMGELGLKQVEPTNIILRLADQRRVKPLGILQGVKTIVA